MANFEGFTPHPYDKFCSLYEQDDVTNSPLGVLHVCRNARFHVTSVRTRDGVNQKVGNGWFGLNTNQGFPITGLGCFKYEGNGVNPDKQVPVVFDAHGNLYVEQPAGSGTLVPIASTQVVPSASQYMQAAQTLNRAYMVFTNIANPAAAGSVSGVYDLNTGVLDPLSMRPVGETWAAGTKYQVGEVVTPILTSAGGNGDGVGKSFRASAITTGVSGNVEPAWPAADGGSVVDGGVTWTENTLLFSNVVSPPDKLTGHGAPITPIAGVSGASPASGFTLDAAVVAGAGGWAAGRDIYIAVTLSNDQGETTTITLEADGINGGSVLNDRIQITVTATVRAWLSNLAVGFAPTGWSIYTADVAHGAAAPALAAFKLHSAGHSLLVNTVVNVDGAGAGAAPPTANTARITAAGNVDGGTRWAGVLFVNRNGYISGYGTAQVVENNVDIAGFELLFLNIAIGPVNTAQRIVFLSQAGGTSAGPFAYLPEADSFNGIPITASVINDNVTTTTTLNFEDIYLEDILSTTANVTTFFDKIQIPECRSIYYSQTLDRMIYLAYETPSGALISLPGDPETVMGSTGTLEVAETDGQNLMGFVDWHGIQYALKEASGHEVNPSNDDPVNWTYTKRWDGVGPCGLRAFDSNMRFIVFVHRTGVWVFMGDTPERITKEIPITWARVNWAAAQTIWVKIDEDTKEILVGVPLDRATVPSHILSCNYEESVTLNPAVHSTIYSRGKFISSAAARKWSLQDIPANSAIRTIRTVANPPAQFDPATIQSQLWFASSFDGAVRASTPGFMYDDFSTTAIPFVIEPVCPGDALSVSRLGGLQGLMTGQGSIGMSVLAGSVKASADGGVTNRQTEIKARDAIVQPGATTDYKWMGSGVNERFRPRVSTVGKAAGTWVDVLTLTIYINPLFQARSN